MSIEGLKQIKLLLIGETGDGKSSLGNFILKNDVFKVSDSNKTVTKYTGGYFGEGDRSDVFVVDTHGLNDSSGFDNKNIQNIVNCVKATGLQGIILTMNYNVARFSTNLKQVVKVISDIFPLKDIWKHVCIVWTKCYNYSQPDEDDDNTRTEEEIIKLIKWARRLKPIDKEEINKLSGEYKEIKYEEKEEREKIEETKYNTTYKITKYIRCKKVKNSGEVIYGESTEFNSRIITENKTNKETSECVVM
ncbi:aig1, putative [Entamoeba dispar SAW760]|uniref:Aig1, putative n=1 Tax=Entamoeba dispar (strain ATCC PRA-260 / SAW760) TaxID=370354 RepID=B0EAD8_ENTDS|nr:aig1, putative [Entamoeba dispar SAW760]EDR28523.1 aig1, putative [Entamoeba dispar SAW760]|eukprot:EDR28523.1 aig1, putative [Entamoeba dispar SAW760]